MAKQNSLFALGNPLLDISVTVPKEYLDKYELKENDAILAEEKHMKIYDEIKDMNPNYLPGGATQNAINVAQWIMLPNKEVAVFTGSIKDDSNGKILDTECKKNGVKTAYYYHDGPETTGICACLINGHNRSLVTNLGAANCFKESHLDDALIKPLLEEAQTFYISSFVLTGAVPSMQKIATHAAVNNKTFIMNLSAPFLCQFFMEPMMTVMPKVTILFGNETEAVAFAQTQKWTDIKENDVTEIAKRIANLPLDEHLVNHKRTRLVVITQGSLPVITATTNEAEVKMYPVNKIDSNLIVDTNGAGDAFVGGFLAQFVQGQSLDVCFDCAIWAGQLVIQQMGCTLPEKCTYKRN